MYFSGSVVTEGCVAAGNSLVCAKDPRRRLSEACRSARRLHARPSGRGRPHRAAAARRSRGDAPRTGGLAVLEALQARSGELAFLDRELVPFGVGPVDGAELEPAA